jgi:hypothetical protein
MTPAIPFAGDAVCRRQMTVQITTTASRIAHGPEAQDNSLAR